VGDLAEFPLPVRVFLRAYRWRRIDPIPWSPLRKPLSRARVALVASAGLSLPGEPRFDASVHGGDPSFRWIARDVDVATLVESHRSASFDHAGIARDRNLALPLDRLRELAARGRIGEVAPRHLSFMGGITAPGRLVRESAPRAARALAADGVDAALLVPV
jgi:D-proline reductase (dithiol) PrdB